MVAAGTGPRTAITLFVIGEGRYTTKNIPEVRIPRETVYWDYTTASSNYALVRDSLYGLEHSFFVPYSSPTLVVGWTAFDASLHELRHVDGVCP